MLRPAHALFSLLVLTLAAGLVRAQAPSVATPTKADYTKEAVVAELVSMKVSFENDGTSVQELTTRIRVQSDAGVQRYGLLTFSYQGATQTVDFDYIRV